MSRAETRDGVTVLTLTDADVETLTNALRIARDACTDDVRTLRAMAARLEAAGDASGAVAVQRNAAEASQGSARAYGGLLDRIGSADWIRYEPDDDGAEG